MRWLTNKLIFSARGRPPAQHLLEARRANQLLQGLKRGMKGAWAWAMAGSLWLATHLHFGPKHSPLERDNFTSFVTRIRYEFLVLRHPLPLQLLKLGEQSGARRRHQCGKYLAIVTIGVKCLTAGTDRLHLHQVHSFRGTLHHLHEPDRFQLIGFFADFFRTQPKARATGRTKSGGCRLCC